MVEDWVGKARAAEEARRREQEGKEEEKRLELVRSEYRAKILEVPKKILDEIGKHYHRIAEEMEHLSDTPRLSLDWSFSHSYLNRSLWDQEWWVFGVAVHGKWKSDGGIKRWEKKETSGERYVERDTDVRVSYSNGWRDPNSGMHHGGGLSSSRNYRNIDETVTVTESTTCSDSYKYEYRVDPAFPNQITVSVVYQTKIKLEKSHRYMLLSEKSEEKSQEHYRETYTVPLASMPTSQESVDQVVNALLEDIKHPISYTSLDEATRRVTENYVPPSFPGREIRVRYWGIPTVEDTRRVHTPEPPMEDFRTPEIEDQREVYGKLQVPTLVNDSLLRKKILELAMAGGVAIGIGVGGLAAGAIVVYTVGTACNWLFH